LLTSHITSPAAYRPLLQGRVWDEVFAWIEAMDPTLPDGIHTIRGEEIFVNLHRYETLPREDCRWESHRRYIDLQYCLKGEETIDVINRAHLEDDGNYDEEKDLLFHLPETPPISGFKSQASSFSSSPSPNSSSSPARRRGGPSPDEPVAPQLPAKADGEVPISDSQSTIRYTPLQMTPGTFAIFFPQDAHRPKVRPAKYPTTVRKFVVKIALDAL